MTVACLSVLPSVSVDQIFAFTKAIHSGQKETVEEYLKNGMPPNFIHEHHLYPLIEAASTGNSDIVDLLLEYGADPNASDSVGNTSLHAMFLKDHPNERSIRLLIKKGTILETKNNNGQTALLMAILCANDGAHDFSNEILCLLEHGARWDNPDFNGATPYSSMSFFMSTQMANSKTPSASFLRKPLFSGDVVKSLHAWESKKGLEKELTYIPTRMDTFRVSKI